LSYTTADLTKIQAAIIALAEGKRVVSVTVNGKIIAYGQSQIKELQALRDSIQAEMNAASSTRRFVLTTTGKGL